MSDDFDVAAIVKAAVGLLSRGDAEGAERLLSPVAERTRDPAVLHLMGQVKKGRNKWDEAERYFRSAIAGTLTKGEYYNDLGVVLQARGANAEAERLFRAAIALLPGSGAIYVNLVRCLLAMDDLAGAEEQSRAYVRVLPSAESWTLLSSVLRSRHRYEEALAAADAALKYSPQARGLLHNRAILLDALGHGKEAYDLFAHLARDGLDSPELAVNFSRALHLEGNAAEAEGVLEQAVGHWRGNVRAHSALARMRWLRGAGEESTLFIEQAMEERPQDLPLRLVCADLVNRAGFKEKAVRILEEGLARAPGSPAFLTSLGIVLDEMDRTAEALQLLREAASKSPFQATAQKNLIVTLLRARLADEAITIIRALRRADPLDQQMIAHEASALRMLGDTGAYRELYDYGRLVKVYDLAAPRGFFSVENFNAALGESLRHLHTAAAHPLDQSLRNGSQTGRNLLQVPEPNIEAFLAALDKPIRAYIDALGPKPAHPMDVRRAQSYALQSCWSVLLRPGGHHVNHIHASGWISSAYYVSVPPEVETSSARAGWLKFGEPSLATPGCEPDHFVKPEQGMLVLFPSYMWHGTVPFTQDAERLTMSFDVTPK